MYVESYHRLFSPHLWKPFCKVYIYQGIKIEQQDSFVTGLLVNIRSGEESSSEEEQMLHSQWELL